MLHILPGFRLLLPEHNCFRGAKWYDVIASGLAVAGQSAPIYAIAFAAFILLLGYGLNPISDGSEEAFANRLLNVLIGNAYAVAALSVASIDTPRSNTPRLASRRADFLTPGQ